MKKPTPIYYVMDANQDKEYAVEVEYDRILLSEDESYADISAIYLIDEDREIFEQEIHPDSLAKLQAKLDDICMETAHEDWYEQQMSRAYDRAKDRMKYGD